MFADLGHSVARGISSMQTGKHIDLSMERKCLRWEGGPPYIDTSLRLCLSCDSQVCGVSRNSAQPPYVA